MAKPTPNELFEELLDREFRTEEERAAFEREVELKVASARLINALEGARAERSVSKAELARQIGKPRSVVSRLLSGHTVNANITTLAKVADALGVYLDVEIKPQPDRAKRHSTIEVRAPKAIAKTARKKEGRRKAPAPARPKKKDVSKAAARAHA